jgi:hypothetical protein
MSRLVSLRCTRSFSKQRGNNRYNNSGRRQRIAMKSKSGRTICF